MDRAAERRRTDAARRLPPLTDGRRDSHRGPARWPDVYARRRRLAELRAQFAAADDLETREEIAAEAFALGDDWGPL